MGAKGGPKTGGRKKGSLNKCTKELGGRVQEILENHIDEAEEKLNRIVDPEKWMMYYIKLLEFRLPKMQSVALSSEARLSDLKSELEELAEKEV